MTAFKLRCVVYICRNFWSHVITSDTKSLQKFEIVWYLTGKRNNHM